MSVIFFNFRNQNFKIEIWFVWWPPPPYFISCLSAVGWCFGITLTLIFTVKTFPTHFKANYNKLETQNGGGECVFWWKCYNAANLWKCQTCAFYGLRFISWNWYIYKTKHWWRLIFAHFSFKCCLVFKQETVEKSRNNIVSGLPNSECCTNEGEMKDGCNEFHFI